MSEEQNGNVRSYDGGEDERESMNTDTLTETQTRGQDGAVGGGGVEADRVNRSL